MEHYDTRAALRMMVYDSGVTQREISARLGATPTYISTYMSKNTSPSAEKFVRFAHACGWKVQIVKDDRVVELKP